MVPPPPPVLGGVVVPPPLEGGVVVVPPPPLEGGVVVPPPVLGGIMVPLPPPPVLGGVVVVPPPPLVGGVVVVPPPLEGGSAAGGLVVLVGVELLLALLQAPRLSAAKINGMLQSLFMTHLSLSRNGSSAEFVGGADANGGEEPKKLTQE